MYINCKQCGFEASNTSNLRNHRYEAHKLNETCCLHCGLKFKMKSSLDRHMREKHLGMEYACTMCNFIGNRKSDLKRHISKVHKDCNSRAHAQCEECDLIALDLNSLYMRAEQDTASSLDVEASQTDARSEASSRYQIGLAQAYSGKLEEAEANLQAAFRILEARGENNTKAENTERVALEKINLEIKEVKVDQLVSLA